MRRDTEVTEVVEGTAEVKNEDMTLWHRRI